MIRLFTKTATGIAPDGAWLAGDVNALQDAVAAISDYTQDIELGSILIGDGSIQLQKFGTAEASLSAALRTSGVLRGLGGVLPGVFTSTQRDAITAPPTGLVIYNSTNSRHEWNAGTSGSPSWEPLGGGTDDFGNLADIPDPGDVQGGSLYYAEDQDVAYVSDGSAWTRSPGTPKAGDLYLSLNAVAATGRVLCQGQAWPGTTGIWADLHTMWGGSTLPDMRGRMPVVIGTHADVSGIRNTEQENVSNRTPKHKHTVVQPTVSATIHLRGSTPGGTQGSVTNVGNFSDGSDNTNDIVHTTATGGTVGPQTGSNPTDTPAFYVVQMEAHL